MTAAAQTISDDARPTTAGTAANLDGTWSPAVDLVRLDDACRTRDAIDGVVRTMGRAIDALAGAAASAIPADPGAGDPGTRLSWSAGDLSLSHETIRHAGGRHDALLRLTDRNEIRTAVTTIGIERADHPAVHPDPHDPTAAARRLLDVLAAVAAAPSAAKDAAPSDPTGSCIGLPAPMLAAALRVAEASGSNEVETTSATPFSNARVRAGMRRWRATSRNARGEVDERIDANMPRECSIDVEQSTPIDGDSNPIDGDRSVTVLIGPVVQDIDVSGVPHLEALRILAAHPAPSPGTPDRDEPDRMGGTAASTSELPPRGSTPDRPIILHEGRHTTPANLRIMLGRIAELRSIVAEAVDSATKPETAITNGRVSHAGFTALDGRIASHQESADSWPGLQRRSLISVVPVPTFSVVFDKCSNDVGRPSQSDRRKGAEDLLDAIEAIVRDAIDEGVPFDPLLRRAAGDGITGLPRELDLIAIGHALAYDAHAASPRARVIGGRRIVNVATPNPMMAQHTSSTHDETVEHDVLGIASAVRVVVEVDDIGRPNHLTVEPVIHHVALAAIDPVETLRAIAAHAEHLARHRANPSDPS